MSRRVQLSALSLTAVLLLGARKPDDPRHENHYAAVNTIGTTGLQVDLNGAESQRDFVKVDGKLTNTTGDTLFVLKKDEGNVTLPSATAALKPPTLFPGPMVLEPGGKGSYTWMANTPGVDYHVDRFALNVAGLYRAPNIGTALPAPAFTMPASTNVFAAGPFACSLSHARQETQDTTADFQCTYGGTGVGYIDARRISARAGTGREFANLVKNAKRDVLTPGAKAKFAIWFQIPASEGDMQTVPFDLLFHDAFSEAPLTAIPLDPWRFEVDPAATADANK